MRIAVASGKGGTGKTTIAVHAAVTAASNGIDTVYVDCDVEEPNGHIFLKPKIIQREQVTVRVPIIDESMCTYCGECGRICRFKAIAVILDKVIVFDELCHGCGGCTLVCPEGAISESDRPVGVVETGTAGIDLPGKAAAGIGPPGGGPDGSSLLFVQGRLDIGEHLAPPIIRRLKECIPKVSLEILDAPPGASCPVVESVRGADLVLLVTEPTPFGLNDLEIAVEMMRELGLEIGVVINRAGIGDDRVKRYCRKEGIEIMAEIPDDRRVAEIYSRGDLVTNAIPQYGGMMQKLLGRITRAEVVE